ncbi:hypothetical protein LguiB_032158 [Lonicera macranthoides]
MREEARPKILFVGACSLRLYEILSFQSFSISFSDILSKGGFLVLEKLEFACRKGFSMCLWKGLGLDWCL